MEQFQSHINNQCDRIKFTLEKEEEKSLPFLDVLITKNPDGSLSHQVYRKKMHTDIYLHVDSHHHPSQKIGIIKTLGTHACRVSDTYHINKELEHLKLFQSVKRKRNKTKEKDTTFQKIIVPYIHGMRNKIANVIRKKNIRVTFSPPNSLRTMLDKSQALGKIYSVNTIPTQ